MHFIESQLGINSKSLVMFTLHNTTIPFNADDKQIFLRTILLHIKLCVIFALTNFLHAPKIRTAMSKLLFVLRKLMSKVLNKYSIT